MDKGGRGRERGLAPVARARPTGPCCGAEAVLPAPGIPGEFEQRERVRRESKIFLTFLSSLEGRPSGVESIFTPSRSRVETKRTRRRRGSSKDGSYFEGLSIIDR